jgi:hypothetical protein
VQAGLHISPEWLTAIGGVLVFAATAALAVIAKRQMDLLRRSSTDEAAAVQKQIDASLEQGRAIRDAARAQLQPIVFAHGDRTFSGPDDSPGIDLHADQLGFSYHLGNEGTGIALNISHGVEVGGVEYEFGGGMQMRVLRPDERQPPADFINELGQTIRYQPLVVAVPRGALAEDWSTTVVQYWTRYDNVFGERFETRNPSRPDVPAEFRRIDGEA